MLSPVGQQQQQQCNLMATWQFVEAKACWIFICFISQMFRSPLNRWEITETRLHQKRRLMLHMATTTLFQPLRQKHCQVQPGYEGGDASIWWLWYNFEAVSPTPTDSTHTPSWITSSGSDCGGSFSNSSRYFSCYHMVFTILQERLECSVSQMDDMWALQIRMWCLPAA